MEPERFRNRNEAGRLLANKLTAYANRPDVLVLALPRGGVPVAYEVARALGAPLDVFVVRKLGVPGHEELAMGAIATGGVRVLNDQIVQRLRIPEYIVDAVAAREQPELRRRERLYRGGRPPPQVRGRTVILVDDGLATGATMRAAIMALRQLQPARIVVAIPTGSPETCEELKRKSTKSSALLHPTRFSPSATGTRTSRRRRTRKSVTCSRDDSSLRRRKHRRVRPTKGSSTRSARPPIR
jgi:predicted phosphoribosyltransferase